MPRISRIVAIRVRASVNPIPHAQPIENGGDDLVFGGKGLCPAQNDAVDHNERDEDSKGAVQCGQERLHQQLDDGNKRCDNHDIGRNPNLCRDEVAQQRDHHI